MGQNMPSAIGLHARKGFPGMTQEMLCRRVWDTQERRCFQTEAIICRFETRRRECQFYKKHPPPPNGVYRCADVTVHHRRSRKSSGTNVPRVPSEKYTLAGGLTLGSNLVKTIVWPFVSSDRGNKIDCQAVGGDSVPQAGT